MLPPIVAKWMSWRFSDLSVSGSRSHTQVPTTSERIEVAPKIQRQSANSRIICPNEGAIIGTAMNTSVIVDSTRAIRSPE